MSPNPALHLAVLLAAACALGAWAPRELEPGARDIQATRAPATTQEAQEQEAKKIDPEALRVLKAMSDHLARAKTIKLSASTLHDVVAPSGIKSLIAMEVVGHIKRPNRLHLRYRRDDGASRLVWYDGATLSSFDPHLLAYSSLELEKASIGDLADHLIENYELNLTLADFLYEDSLAAFRKDLLSGVHKGLRYVDGTICDYLAFESAGADFQLWVTTGPNPVPRRFVVTYVTKPGEPQYIATLNWQLDGYLDDGMFRFTPPAGVTKQPLPARK